MIRIEEYSRLSLELHLFFARIMKEHSLFLEAGFMGKDEDFKRKAKEFQKEFGHVLHKAIELGDGCISEEVLRAEEIVTKDTLQCESVTNKSSGFHIDEDITKKELQLKSGMARDNEAEVHHLNENVLHLLNDIIAFKTEVQNKVLECKMFTVNYPLLLTHMLREAQMYRDSLMKLQKKEQTTLREQEEFWNRQMMEHAEFIRGLLDPTEEDLILKADKFAHEYKQIIKEHHQSSLTGMSLQETIAFKKFKEAGSDGILSCKIKSIIMPILVDHLLREANHYIRVMSEKHYHNPY